LAALAGGPPAQQLLRDLVARIVLLVDREPRIGDTLLAWLALRRLVQWKSPTGRYNEPVDELMQEWVSDERRGYDLPLNWRRKDYSFGRPKELKQATAASRAAPGEL